MLSTSHRCTEWLQWLCAWDARSSWFIDSIDSYSCYGPTWDSLSFTALPAARFTLAFLFFLNCSTITSMSDYDRPPSPNYSACEACTCGPCELIM